MCCQLQMCELIFCNRFVSKAKIIIHLIFIAIEIFSKYPISLLIPLDTQSSMSWVSNPSCLLKYYFALILWNLMSLHLNIKPYEGQPWVAYQPVLIRMHVQCSLKALPVKSKGDIPWRATSLAIFSLTNWIYFVVIHVWWIAHVMSVLY